MDISEFLDLFVGETTDHLESIEATLLDIDRAGSADAEQLNELFRLIHTLKGNSRMMGFTGVSQVCHEAEDLLGLAREGKRPLDTDDSGTLLRLVDVLRQWLREPSAMGEQMPSQLGPVSEALRRTESQAKASPAPRGPVDWDRIFPESAPLSGETHGAVHVLRLRGQFSLHREDQIQDALIAIQDSVPEGDVALDLSQIPVLSLSVVGTLVSVGRHLGERGQRVCLCGANAAIRRMFSTTGLAKRFALLPDVEAFLAGQRS